MYHILSLGLSEIISIILLGQFYIMFLREAQTLDIREESPYSISFHFKENYISNNELN